MNKESNPLSDGSAWAQTIGALTIASGMALSSGSLGWLFTSDGNLESQSIRVTVLGLQFCMVAAGFFVIFKPELLKQLADQRLYITGSVLSVFLIGIVGALGSLSRPDINYLLPTDPEFICDKTAMFCNRAESAGLRDQIRYGKGAAFVDMDGDGWVDLYAANADRRLRKDDWGVSAFYLNNGDGSFRPVDLGVSSEDLLSNWSASFADIDNDGDLDVALAGGGYAGQSRISLYENRIDEEGRFVSITDNAGLKEFNSRPYRWWGLGWADYDNDGLLDLAVSRVYGPVLLLHNDGNNKFSNVTRSLGIATPDPWTRDGKNIVWFDFDNDGDQDLYFAGIENHMFYQNLDGRAFQDVTDEILVGQFPKNVFHQEGAPVVFAAAAADFDQDGHDDLYLGRQAEQDLVMFNQGDGTFRVAGAFVGIDTERVAVWDKDSDFENTAGLGVGDLFDDGWPDVVIGSGAPERADMDAVFCNIGGTFERCTEVLYSGSDGPFRTRAYGIVFGDVDQDGASDVFQNMGGDSWWDRKYDIDSRQYGALFINNSAAKLKTATLILEGVISNRDAIGARVRLEADETHFYTVRSTQAFQSQNEPAIILALGEADEGKVQIDWPSGLTTALVVKAGQRIRVRESD
ncbi:MAG: CRTAC1 family protein [Gammaproteobacteria bacterium]|jgi:hypothetical protein